MYYNKAEQSRTYERKITYNKTKMEEITEKQYKKMVKELSYLSFRQVKGNEAEVLKFCNNDTCEIELDDTVKKIEVETVWNY